MQGADLVSVATRKLYANHRQLYYCVLQTNPSAYHSLHCMLVDIKKAS